MVTALKFQPVNWLKLAIMASCFIAGVNPCLSFADESGQISGTDLKAIDHKAYDQSVAKAIDHLLNKGQASNGSFSGNSGLGVTSLCTLAVLKHGRSPEEPAMKKALKYLEGFVQADGGIYTPGTLYRNYETSLSVLAFNAANKNSKYDELLANADKFLKGIQMDESEDRDPSDTDYGGAGYGKHKRPDLSNTNFLMDALIANGNGPEDEAVQKALLFISRCQNLESEHNTFDFARKNPDGGFYYTIAAGGSSQAGVLPNGGLRSYGSMTYAGLKSMIYAGVKKDDQRVKAAIKWLGKNYSLEQNPGMGDSGLYYYYHTFAKSLDAVGEDYFIDEQGTKHDWRAELRAELISRQNENGTWVNENARWLEGDANLVTGYALLALHYAHPQTGKP